MIQSGLYKHYKGALVQVLGTAQDCQTGRLYVVGIKLSSPELPGELVDSRLRVRELEDFCGTVVVDGSARQRFELVYQGGGV